MLSRDESVLRILRAKERGLKRASAIANQKWCGLASPAFTEDDKSTARCKKCGQLVIFKGNAMECYSEILIIFDDNSAHITSLCGGCSSGLSVVDLEAIYCADILDLSNDEDRSGVLMDWTLLADRKPVGFERRR